MALEQTGEVERARTAVLEAARAALRARLSAARGDEAAPSGPVDELDDLVNAAEAVLDGRDPAVVRRALRPRSRRPGLVAALRDEVLRHPAASSDPAAVLAVLQSIEVLTPRGAEWWQGAEETSLQSLEAEPSAFELLVEVAHDLRSPLTSVLFLSETLRAGHSGEVNDLQRSQLGLIYSAALGLHSMASDVMELAKEGREAEEAPQAFTVVEVFRNVEEMVRPMAEEKDVELRKVLPEYGRFVGHPIILGRVLLNLTTNALKFTSEGYVEMAARRRRSGRVQFSVRDTGRGIEEARQSDLFEPFKKAGERRGYFFSGAGLGLSIARRLVRRMDSELELETRPGWGTRFYFELDLPPASSL